MHRTRKLFATTMIAAAGAVSAAMALSATASAQPAPAPAPAPEVPGLPFLQQLAANPAAATQIVQGFANMMGTAPAAPAATAATTPATPVSGPGATASISLPQPANVLPGATALPGGNMTTVPVGNTTTAPQTAPASPLSGLTDSLGVPGGLASLLPAGTPLANLLPTGETAPVAAAPAPAPVPPLFTPLSALP
ncbi:hypothetical protein [Mycobacterium sp. NAZ190054]|uniref:hypothetical protein n=1 Tax=Mycobacterium sp. NAZ190054 TaxID=1747766 RepID=UPI00079227F5|nr:hypothetical protein [Mycobacterium sp. NAZ190054]KWX67201.1 hypothetical protein ASJ79_22570 [Mycobacterium sp. NAZ190054]